MRVGSAAMVGSSVATVGAAVGLTVGDSDGLTVGAAVGLTVGRLVGWAVLSQHALNLPVTVGQQAMPIGNPNATHRVCAPQSANDDGLKVGAMVGDVVGAGVGLALGPVGARVGVPVVGKAVG